MLQNEGVCQAYTGLGHGVGAGLRLNYIVFLSYYSPQSHTASPITVSRKFTIFFPNTLNLSSRG